MLRLLPLLLLLVYGTVSAELEIRDAWIKNLPPTVPVRAGYLTLANPHSKPIKIISVESAAFASIEIHQTVEHNGMMSMDRVEQLTIDAHSSLQLAPGGLHLMMMMPQQEMRPGDWITVSISYDDGSRQELKMKVRR